LQKEKHTNAFLNSLKQRLSDDQKQLLLRQSESRLDSELSFFIRLDKDRLLNENRFWITDSGNCFHIRMSIAAYPSNREAALKVISQWLS
jgi:RNA binding exosome subunit